MMRVTTAALALLLWAGTAGGFAPAVPTAQYSGVASKRAVVSLNAVEEENNEVARPWAVMPLSTAAVTSLMAASLFLWSPLPTEAASAPPPATTTSSIASPEQRAIASAKSALDDATKKYNAALNKVKEELALDKKAQLSVDTAEQKLEKARKNFIGQNDKLSQAKTKGNQDVVAKQTKLVADAKAAVTSAETELNAAKIQKVNTAKKVVAAQSNAGDYERLIKSDKSIIEQEESKIQAQKEKAAKLAQQEKAQKEKAAKRAQQEKKRLDELAKKKQEQAKKVEQEFKKKAEKQKKELERVAKEKEQRLEKQKKETAKRAKEQAQKVEKAKKEAAKIAEEKKKKEINIVQDRISQLKSAKQKMKKQGKSEKALQLMDARIAAEQDVIFKIKTK